jgi:hypothetical protein
MSSPTAAQVTLAWNASVSLVDGYWLYDGTASGIYTAGIDVGPVTRYLIGEVMDWQELLATRALREGTGLGTMHKRGDAQCDR